MNIRTKRFETPDEARKFLKGTFDVAKLGGITIGRASYEPGWKWSEPYVSIHFLGAESYAKP